MGKRSRKEGQLIPSKKKNTVICFLYPVYSVFLTQITVFKESMPEEINEKLFVYFKVLFSKFNIISFECLLTNLKKFLDDNQISLIRFFLDIVLQNNFDLLKLNVEYDDNNAIIWEILIRCGIEYNLMIGKIVVVVDINNIRFIIKKTNGIYLYTDIYQIKLSVTKSDCSTKSCCRFTSKISPNIILIKNTDNISYSLMSSKFCKQEPCYIGHGGYGNVLGISDNSSNGHQLAVKIFKDKEYMMREVEILIRLKNTGNKCIQAYHGSGLLNPGNGYCGFIVSTLYQHGTLNQFLKKNPRDNIFSLFKRIIHGLKCIHDLNIVHLDIKGTNICIDDEKHPVIIDFGISKPIGRVLKRDLYFTCPYRPPILTMQNELYPNGVLSYGHLDIWAALIELLKSFSSKKLRLLELIKTNKDLQRVYEMSFSYNMLVEFESYFNKKESIIITRKLYNFISREDNQSDINVLLESVGITDILLKKEVIDIINRSKTGVYCWMDNLIHDALEPLNIDEETKNKMKCFFKKYLDVDKNILGLDHNNDVSLLISELDEFARFMDNVDNSSS